MFIRYQYFLFLKIKNKKYIQTTPLKIFLKEINISKKKERKEEKKKKKTSINNTRIHI